LKGANKTYKKEGKENNQPGPSNPAIAARLDAEETGAHTRGGYPLADERKFSGMIGIGSQKG